MPDNTGAQQLDMQIGEREALAESSLRVQGICEEIILFPNYNDQYPVYINMTVWRQLWQYACDNRDREIGGVLLGTFLHDDNSDGLNIQAYLPGRYMEETLASLTFTHKTWTDINQRLMREYNDKRIIGWFHTHPGHGIFMSRYDLYIHQSYFAGEGQVAVVFDPAHRSAGFFQRRQGRMRQLRTIHIYTLAGDAFDQNTRDFIAAVGEHSLPQCQPTLAMPSLRIDIHNGPFREARHQGLAFLLQLMDIRKKDQKEAEAGAVSAREAANAPAGEAMVRLAAGSPAVTQLLNPSALTGQVIRDSGEISATAPDTSWLAASPPSKAEFIGQLGENLDLYSGDFAAGRSRVYGNPEGDAMPEPEVQSVSYMPLPIGPAADAISGPDISPSGLPGPSPPASFVQMTRELEEERLDVIKKKLTPIKDQVVRDLRQAEREILSPSGYMRAEYSAKKPYNEDLGADTFSIMS